jgi:hypothetical protein
MTDASMSIVARTTALLLAAFALCGAARAQVAPVSYWIPGGAFGLGGAAVSADSWSHFPSFDAAALADGADWRDAIPTGAFLRSQSGPVGWSGLGLAGIGQFGALSSDSVQAGYSFRGLGNLPVSVYAGFDTLNYSSGLASHQAPFGGPGFSSLGTTARAGIAIAPSPNVSLSFEAGVMQPGAGRLDSDIRSPLLPGETPLFLGRR